MRGYGDARRSKIQGKIWLLQINRAEGNSSGETQLQPRIERLKTEIAAWIKGQEIAGAKSHEWERADH
jgi:hypothetical protein